MAPSGVPDHLLVGIDTGGTFTDAAVVDAATHRVLATAKALTTRGDLAVGVAGALRAAIGGLPADRIGLVSVSTTLATNAVVEGHGDDVAAVLVGFDAAMAERTGLAAAFPGMPIALVGGGHDHGGNEVAPLDLDALRAAAAELPPRVGALAVSATFSTRNPAHEERAADLLHRSTGLPVTRSGELSNGLDAPRRALTAALNARLIGRVVALVGAVRRAMHELGIRCPLMLVKGDGSLALADSVAARPIETVLSGPAASVVGAAWLSRLDDFLLADIGGTTTDLGLVRSGRPRLVDHGAEVGGWRTMVRAIDVRTVGLGGDSLVVVEPDRVVLRPDRVVPVSLAASHWPIVEELLRRDLADARSGGALHGRFVVRTPGSPESPPSADRDAALLHSIGSEPRPLREVAATSRQLGVLDSLRRRGLVQLVGFTPSDAAHVLGRQETWSVGAADLGAQLGARLLEMRAPTPERGRAFAERVWGEAVRRSAHAVLETALGPGCEGPLLDAVCDGRPEVGAATVAVRPQVPVVAVGGPARVVYPEVGRRIGCDVVFPPHLEVANAVGAATGAIVRRVEVEVHADDSGYRVHGPDGVERHTDPTGALARAAELARAAATAAVAALGGEAAVATVEVVQRIDVPGREDDGRLISAVLAAEAVGRPSVTS